MTSTTTTSSSITLFAWAPRIERVHQTLGEALRRRRLLFDRHVALDGLHVALLLLVLPRVAALAPRSSVAATTAVPAAAPTTPTRRRASTALRGGGPRTLGAIRCRHPSHGGRATPSPSLRCPEPPLRARARRALGGCGADAHPASHARSVSPARGCVPRCCRVGRGTRSWAPRVPRTRRLPRRHPTRREPRPMLPRSCDRSSPPTPCDRSLRSAAARARCRIWSDC